MEVEVVTREAEFAALRDDWHRVLAASRTATIFLTWEWAYTWWRHFAGDARLHIVVVRRNGRVVGIAPWMVQGRSLSRLALMPSLQFIGGGPGGADYLDVIVARDDEPEAIAALSEYLGGKAWTLDLMAMREDARARLLTAGLSDRGWRAERRSADLCPYIGLAGCSWDSYAAGLGRSHRENFKRRLNRLRRAHAMRFEAASTNDERVAAIETLMALHNQRWSPRGGSTAFHTPELVNFHRVFSKVALERGWLRLLTLVADDQPAALLYGFSFAGVFLFYQGGFDQRWASHSVGLVTMGLTIQSACEEGLLEFDLLHGAEPYKFLWTQEWRGLARFDLYPPRIGGTVSQLAAGAIRRMRRSARQLLEVAGVRTPAVVASTR